MSTPEFTVPMDLAPNVDAVDAYLESTGSKEKPEHGYVICFGTMFEVDRYNNTYFYVIKKDGTKSLVKNNTSRGYLEVPLEVTEGLEDALAFYGRYVECSMVDAIHLARHDAYLKNIFEDDPGHKLYEENAASFRVLPSNNSLEVVYRDTISKTFPLAYYRDGWKRRPLKLHHIAAAFADEIHHGKTRIRINVKCSITFHLGNDTGYELDDGHGAGYAAGVGDLSYTVDFSRILRVNPGKPLLPEGWAEIKHENENTMGPPRIGECVVWGPIETRNLALRSLGKVLGNVTFL